MTASLYDNNGRGLYALTHHDTTPMTAQTTERVYRIALCRDCVYTDANGWDERETGHPLPEPAPLSMLNVLEPVLLGSGWDGHECEGFYSTSPCDGCGDRLAGTRYCYTAIYGR